MITQHKNIYANLENQDVDQRPQGTYTTLGGSLMPPEVVQAMAEAAGWFVSIPELQEKVGRRIAELLKVPAAALSPPGRPRQSRWRRPPA